MLNALLKSKIRPGDILSIRFSSLGFYYNLKGLCISVRGRSGLSRNTSVTVRNFIGKLTIEWTVSIYSVVVSFFDISLYQRKKVSYRASKLFYLRGKVNRESLVF